MKRLNILYTFAKLVIRQGEELLRKDKIITQLKEENADLSNLNKEAYFKIVEDIENALKKELVSDYQSEN